MRSSSLLAFGALVLLLPACRTTQSDPDRPGFRVRPGVAFEMAVDAPDMPILDLRRPDEFDGPLGHLQRARNVPLEQLPQRLSELRWLQGVTFLVYCRGWNEADGDVLRPGVESPQDSIPGDASHEETDPETGPETDVGQCGERAIRFFLAQGFYDAVLLEGGIEAWLDDGFSTVGRGAQGPEVQIPEDDGLRLPGDAKSIGDPRYLPEPP